MIGRRLARQHLLEPAPKADLVRVASDICCVHAQVQASAELMLGLRVEGITRRDVRDALWSDRSLVKTIALRGTIHLVPAADVSSWIAGNRLDAAAHDRRLRQQGVDLANVERVLAAIDEVVGPVPISRADLEMELEARVGPWAVATNAGWVGSYKNWAMALGRAAAMGLVCYGPDQRGRSTFVRVSEWVKWTDVDPLDAATFVLRRFLHTYGPSTQPEFARWFTLNPALVKDVFARLRDELAEVDVEGSKRWFLQSDLDADAGAAPDAVQLLPHYDVYVVGSHPREQLVEPGSAVAAASPGTAAPLAVLVVGGRVAGVWQRTPKGKRIVIRVDAHRPLTRRQRAAVELQAHRIAGILELECELEFGSVPLRRHL